MLARLRWRELLEFRRPSWRDLAPARAGRIALGIAEPLLIGVFTGHVEDGIFAALGALPAGLASFQGVNRSRLEAVLVTSLGIALSTFVGVDRPRIALPRADHPRGPGRTRMRRESSTWAVHSTVVI